MSRKIYPIAVALGFVAWLIVSWPTLRGLHEKWIDVGDSYVLGYPLLAAAVWLIYQRRCELSTVDIKPSWRGVLLFLMGAILVYAARLIQLQILQQLMLPVLLWCVIFALAGWSMARALLLPIALQYFGMPVWDFLIGMLQQITIAVAHTVLNLVHIPVWLRGNQIHLPDGIITVADSCSGLNLLLAAMLIATLQAEMGRYDTARRTALLIAAASIGLLDNWIRVVALILIAHYSHMQNPLIYSHASFGWWIYAASLVPLFWIAHRLEKGAPATAENIRLPRAVAQAPLGRALVLIAAIVACEYGVAVWGARAGRVQLMQVSGDARVIEPGFTPHYSGYDARQSWELIDNGNRYELSALMYTHQQGKKKLIYYDNVIAPDTQLGAIGSVRVGERAIKFAVVNAVPQRIVWWYYWIDGVVTTSPLRAKLYQLRAVFFGDPSAALIVLSQRCDDAGCNAALQRAQNGSLQAVFAQMLSIKGVTVARQNN